MDLRGCTVAVIGAGTMGAGIAQVAAQAGHRVLLHDSRDGAARDAKAKLAKTLDGLVGKGRLDAASAAAVIERIEPVAALPALAGARLVVEAIVESLDVKRGLFAELEALLADDAVLASNTSSISITALGRDLNAPQRLVGMHFFNPVPLMKLVEVVSGLRTDRAVADAIFELSKAWGKTPVHARSTPGFIVNRIARPYYAEALALLHERYATPEQIDAALRGAGFRMGPCELMDLIGHDVNYAVTESVYAANYFDKRYQPSLVQKELVDGGLLGRKSGRGFYEYVDGKAVGTLSPAGRGQGEGRVVESDRLRRTDGRTAAQLAAEAGVRDRAVFDWPLGEPGGALAYAVANAASEAFAAEVEQVIGAAGFQPLRIGDAPGLIVARTIAMLINEAADAVQQGVCEPSAADAAMKLGVNYPAGPFEWLERIGTAPVIDLLHTLARDTRSERYRVSSWLRQQSLRDGAVGGTVNTKHNPKAVAPPAGKYTHGIGTPAGERWLHISGQIGTAADGTVPPGLEAQVENCWKNVRAILADAGMGMEDLVKVTVFLTMAENIVPYRQARDRIIGDARPASTLVVVSSLVRPEWLCEIEAVAAKADRA